MMRSANSLAASYLVNFFSSAIKPVDYTRTKEIPVLLDVSGILERKDEPLRILDIGSPQILGATLCLYSRNWKVVYMNPFAPELDDMSKRAASAGIKNLDLADGSVTDRKSMEGLGDFDYVFSCSVFEHIHPEQGGDAAAARNLTGLLKPGGFFVFSVPYYKKAFNEYVRGDSYSVKGSPEKKTFFQRFYDEKTLHEDIIIPSKLSVEAKRYIGERFYCESDITKRMAHLIGNGRVSFFLGRFFNLISDIFMEVSEGPSSLKKPYLAVYSLRKAI